MKRILLLGATGMAGHMAYHYLKETGKYDMRNLVFRTPLTEDSIVADVTDSRKVAEVVRALRPDIIVNCIGVLIKGARENPANAILLNAYFPHSLRRMADEVGAKLIHVSTDCVFSGKKGNYAESDFRDADDVYGRSKALGEVLDGNHLTIRTSIIGPELKANGEGLFHWFMSQRGTANGFLTAIWGGVTTLELAKAIDVAIEEDVCGLVQLSNGLPINKYDLLCLFKEIWERDDLQIIPVAANGVDKSIARSARFDYEVPSYRTMLEELAQWMKNHPNLYKQYER